MALKILKTDINIGIKEPIKLLHITDTHITRDNPLDEDRTAEFDVDYKGCAEEYFFEALEYAKQNDMIVLHTGDLIDFFSKGNFDFIDKYFADVNYIYAAGNHDFCHYLGRAKEDYAYKWEKIKEIAPHIKDNLYFDSRIINGVNIVTMDDSYYFISDGQIEMLKAEVAKGYPVILAMHVPLYTKELSEAVRDVWGYYAHLANAPEEMLATYDEARRKQQTPDEATRRAAEYIQNEPAIKALITGHVHFNFESKISDTLRQYTTHGSFSGYVREITIR
ncbi:MAG: metallophosphoesterase [Clostridia bacterium]|nr:metallophosphoesterase [Clostridia bacterium]